MRDPSPTTFENSAIGQLEGSQEPDEAASQSDDSESERTHVPNPQEAGLPSPKAVFQCVGFDQCSAVFPDLVGLNVHVEYASFLALPSCSHTHSLSTRYTHNPTETRFTCHCGMVLPNFIALFQHAQLVHPDEPEKNGALLVEVARPKASAAPFPSSSSRDGTLPSRMTPSDTHSSPLHHDHTPSRSRSARSSRTATPLSIQHHSPPRYISASGELSQSIPPDHGSLPNAAAESSPVQSHPITPARHPHNSSAPTSAPSRSKLSHIGASPRSSIFTPISKFSSSRSKVSQSVPRPSTASPSGMSLKPKTSGWKPRTSTADQSYISAMELEEEDEDVEENTQLSVTKGVIPGNVGFALNRTILGDIDFSPSGDVVTPRRATLTVLFHLQPLGARTRVVDQQLNHLLPPNRERA
ncbi:hypothetical protein FRC02_006036 [Tulasnella sp. 418]|nr:hypothetical protein FRC02_006036 [Tulasnella sp. 418]